MSARPGFDARKWLAAVLWCVAATQAHSVPSITAAADRSCALNAAGGAVCWGDDSSGGLGDGATINSSSPVQVVGLSSGVTQVASGAAAYHTCAVTNAGALLCWGNNIDGELGNGTITSSSVPTPVFGLSSNVASVATGNFHTCALTTSGSVRCFGDNRSGELGTDAVSVYSTTPVAPKGLSATVTAIVAGTNHTCVLTTAQAVLCWGSNGYGQLGQGSSYTSGTSNVPLAVPALSSGVRALSAGFYHTCALMVDGRVLCWGRNNFGQLGNGTTNDLPVPTAVSGLSAAALEVSAGGFHTCARLGSTDLRCWGDNGDGQLGNGTDNDSSVPVAVTGITDSIRMIVTGWVHTCALTSSGAVLCWGYNGKGQFGNGSHTGSLTPVTASRLTVPLTSITSGEVHTCGLTAAGGVLCWGSNSFFQLGNGQAVGESTPQPVVGLSSGLVAIATGLSHTCALNAAGSVECWGEDGQGQLGNGTYSANSSLPVQTLLTSGVRAIAAGDGHTCALTTAGAVLCWGDNGWGQLGNGSEDNNATPTQVTGLDSGVTAITAGKYHTCALKAGGALCWGRNTEGQLGNGSNGNNPSSVPISVLSFPSGVTQIEAGGYHTCVITAAGALYCWGNNGDGELGNGTMDSTYTPTPVDGLGSGVLSVAGGGYHTCAVISAGVRCFGSNSYGQLGNSTLTRSAEPVAVIGLASGIAGIAAGERHTCALTNVGTALCWGRNSVGSLGDGTFAYRTRPVVVLRELGAGTFATNDWFLDLNPLIPKTIASDKIPSFLVTATGNTTFAVVDVKASVQFRPQDVGHPIYVFGYVPASLLKRDPAEKDSGSCLLAQVNQAGQLQAVSASSVQSYVGNVVSTQSQTVAVLNSVRASQVAGGTFCVGSAATGSQAIDTSNSQCAATVPADQVCLPPDRPGELSGLWYNAAESGWGISFTQRRNIVFAAWFTYDASGNPKWYVSNNCVVTTDSSGVRTCDGPLIEVGGPTFFGTTFNSGLISYGTVGNLHVRFSDVNNASMTYQLNGQSRTVLITRQTFATGMPPSYDYTDLWWNASESGWGMAVTQQGSTMFLAWYVYDGSGRPVWYVANNCVVNGNSCSGGLLRTTGPPFGPTFDASRVQHFDAGTVSLSFSDANNGTLTYTVNGVSGTKVITRQLF